MAITKIHISIDTDIEMKFRKRYVIKKGDLSSSIEYLMNEALKKKTPIGIYNPKLKRVLLKKSIEV